MKFSLKQCLFYVTCSSCDNGTLLMELGITMLTITNKPKLVSSKIYFSFETFFNLRFDCPEACNIFETVETITGLWVD